VHLDGTSEDEVRIAHGEAIAAMCDAHLSGIYTNLLPDYGMVVPGDAGAASVAAMLEVEERIRREGAATFTRLGERFARLGVTNELRRIDASPGAMPGSIAAEARWSDLFLATCPYRSDVSAEWDEVVETVLFESGHGVYFVPPASHPRERLSRVVVAWSDTREAARAVGEALPFLRTASEAEIVVVEANGQKSATRGYNAVDIAAHLDRQGVKVDIRPMDHGKRSVSDVLLQEAERGSADLIVMGAYGHSRWREWIMGARRGRCWPRARCRSSRLIREETDAPRHKIPLDEDVESEAAVMLFEPIVAACKGYFVEAPLAATAEAFRFFSHRLAEQAHLLSALSNCRTPSEVLRVQFAFLQQAAHDYGGEPLIVVRRVSDAVH
jgi:nucleotide-binding universal stress UspA family protein